MNTLPTEILADIFSKLEFWYQGSLAAICGSCHRFRDIALPYLYREFAIPVEGRRRVFSPNHYYALTSPSNLGISHIKKLHFVPLDESNPEIKGSGKQDLFPFLKLLQPGQLTALWMDEDVEGDVADKNAWEYLFQTQRNIESLSFNLFDSGLYESFGTTVSPLQHLRVLNFVNGYTLKQMKYMRTWVDANAASLETLGFGYLNVRAQVPDSIDESYIMARRSWVEFFLRNEDGEISTANKGPKLSSLKKLFNTPNAKLEDICGYIGGLIDVSKLTEMAIYIAPSNPPASDMISTALASLINLKSLIYEARGYQHPGIVLSAVRPLECLDLDLNSSYTASDIQVCLKKHKDSLKRLILPSGPHLTPMTINEGLGIWEWPNIQEFGVCLQYPTVKGFPPLMLPRKLKALHLYMAGPGRDFPGELREEADCSEFPFGSEEWIGRWRDSFRKRVPELRFPTIDTTRHRPPLRALICGEPLRAWGGSINFSPKYGANNMIVGWEGTTVGKVLELHPDIELIGSRWSFKRLSAKELSHKW
ncbi:hypothetical protein TWF694_009413 [Orbilia ellipsospora]|uniref:F-box domain-containing protein n=1 Tax=Orbilia ellipsospora TaxID=2528407 RepID=A0AAV9XAQ0_9PEZI